MTNNFFDAFAFTNDPLPYFSDKFHSLIAKQSISKLLSLRVKFSKEKA